MGFISPIATDASGQPKQTGSTQSLGRNDFLQLLVTKLQYQDPLNPMEDEDFVAQLAQFSSLEQMQNIAEGITTSNEWDFLQMQSINNTMASGLIGKDVKATFSGIYYDGDSDPKITYTIDKFAEEVEFTITDSEGGVVATIRATDVAPGTSTIAWDGKDRLGNTVPAGAYDVSVSATDGAGEQFTPSLSLVGSVTAIMYRDGAAYLMVNGTEISLGDVSAIGEPGAFTEEG